MPRGRVATPIDQRFWSHVDKSGDCWLWTRGVNQCGYGGFGIASGKMKLAHRVSWQLTHGDIPSGMCVCHRCDNPACVNPDHLYVGTHSDNMKDRRDRGRQPRGMKHTDRLLTDAFISSVNRQLSAGLNQREVAQRLGVSQMTISRAVRGRR